MLDRRRPAFRPDDGQDIEAARAVLCPSAGEVVSGRTSQFHLLGSPDRILRVGEFDGGSRLDLDEYERIPIDRDEIDFTEGATVVSFEDAVSEPFQVARNQGFAAGTQTGTCVRRSRLPWQAQ
jgi:hypothetical protein